MIFLCFSHCLEMIDSYVFCSNKCGLVALRRFCAFIKLADLQ